MSQVDNVFKDSVAPDPGSEPTAIRRTASASETVEAVRTWWSAQAADYQREHGAFLGPTRFIWCPEGLDEADAQLLGPPARLEGQRILELGCGAAQCAQWLSARGAQVVGLDVAHGQLLEALDIASITGTSVPLAEADAGALPFADASFDIVVSAYGALPFVADAEVALAEVTRVLRPGGRLVASTTHPFRWVFSDDPGPEGLMAQTSYFDRDAYVEQDARGVASYVEHHRTIGDWVRAVTDAGLTLTGLDEVPWPHGHDRTWGGWSQLRGQLIPGTLILKAQRPGP